MHFNERDNQLKISHSDFEAFCKCELMWKLNQDKSIERLPAAPLICGSAFHSTLEALIRGAKDDDLLQGYLQMELQKKNLLDLGAYREKNPELVEKVIEFRDRKGPAMVALFKERVLPKLRPQDVEYWATRDLYEFDGRRYALHCRVDYLDERGWICDWKTTGQSPASAKIERGHKMQARINLFCDKRQDFRFVYFGGSGKAPAVYKQELLLTDELQDWSDLAWQLRPLISRMEEIVFGGVEALPTGSYLSAYAEGQCDYCDYRGRCRHGSCELVGGGKIE